MSWAISWEYGATPANILGKVFSRVEESKGRDEVIFYIMNGEKEEPFARMYHAQDCCECVTIEDVCGDWEDLVGSPILVAEERRGDLPPMNAYDESYTWTFYEFRTIKGSVTVRWYGSSNGYYSEGVDWAIWKGEV